MEGIRDFFAGVKKEVKRVKWPKITDLIREFVLTVVFCVFFGGFFYLVDLLFAFIKGVVS